MSQEKKSTYKLDEFPELKTERVLLRQLHPNDAVAILALHSDDEVAAYIDRKKKKSEEEALSFITKMIQQTKDGHNFYWAIEVNQELAGTFCLWNFTEEGGEIGFELFPKFQGQKIMKECMEEVIVFVKNNLGWNYIEAYARGDNLASLRVLSRHGFEVIKRELKKDSGDVEREWIIFRKHMRIDDV